MFMHSIGNLPKKMLFRFTGDCSPGYWCVQGNDRATPSYENTTLYANGSCFDGRHLGYGGVCSIGHYCPGGVTSTYEIECANGTYSDEEGLSVCKTCPAGGWCILI